MELFLCWQFPRLTYRTEAERDNADRRTTAQGEPGRFPTERPDQDSRSAAGWTLAFNRKVHRVSHELRNERRCAPLLRSISERRVGVLSSPKLRRLRTRFRPPLLWRHGADP